jgi:hypothetical protein
MGPTVIRFVPDSWFEAVMRPIAMAAPNGSVYVETVAPDFRFVFALLLLALLAVKPLRRTGVAGTGAVAMLLTFSAVAFVPWLATTGNGRYFTAVLALAGPLCAALLWQLRVTRALRLTLLTGMVLLQVFLVLENAPWDSWGMKPWKEGAPFAVDVPVDLRDRPLTYVSVSNISYSIIAHQFHPGSRWINLTSQYGDDDASPNGRRTKAFLAAAQDVHLLFPSMPGEAALQRPLQSFVDGWDDILGSFGLRVRAPEACRFLRSQGLTDMGLHRKDEPLRAPRDQRGFWLCPLNRGVAPTAAPDAPPWPAGEEAFNKVERTCPRMFPPGARTTVLPGASRRFYPNTDMRLYVLEDGQVAYKYMRALNMVSLGRIQDVLSPEFRMDCNQIRGRGALPWQREI